MFSISCNSWRNHEEINKDPQRVTKIKLFRNEYESERINFPSQKDDWKKIEKNNLTMALNVLYVKKEKISCLCYKTCRKHAKKSGKYMEKCAPKSESWRWHYLAVKKLSALIFYCLNCLHSFRTKNLKRIKEYVKISTM